MTQPISTSHTEAIEPTIEDVRTHAAISRRQRNTGKLSTLEQIKWIVDNGQMRKIGGQLVDTMTASAILTVHSAISPANQARYMALPIHKIVAIAWKLAR